VKTEHAPSSHCKTTVKKNELCLILRIAGSEASHLVHTLDLSNHGAKLGAWAGREERSATRSKFATATSRHNSESLGSFLTRAPWRGKSGPSAWSRRNRSGVRPSLSKRTSTKKKVPVTSPNTHSRNDAELGKSCIRDCNRGPGSFQKLELCPCQGQSKASTIYSLFDETIRLNNLA
jgi:hypothetical protein